MLLTFFLLSGAALLSLLLLTNPHTIWVVECAPFGQVSGLSLELPLLLDVKSSSFVWSVGLISTAVMSFSRDYMITEKHSVRFHSLVMLFIASMVLLISSPNLLAAILGWDGLGVTSFLLVVYFQSPKALSAGMLTALTNRVGDVTLITSIVLWASSGGWEYVFSSPGPSASAFLIIALVITAMTKSAQVPFSAWLPAAMAAPTPVSALVHSSTLVTAGVYLLVRAIPLLGGKSETLFWVGLTTLTMAGLAALTEVDMKKIVALSTLSQLGLMFTALGAGLKEEAFFHLLTHAYFKALLFIAVGNAIHLSKSFQDLRQVGMSPLAYPFTLSVALLANLSLAGVPFLSGFYSKDLIIEMSLGASSSLPGFFVLLSSVAVTAAYTCRLINLICGRLHSPSGAFPASDNSPPVIKATAWLVPFAVFGGSLLSWSLLPSPSGVFLPGELKMSTLMLIVFAISLSSMLPWHSSQPSALNWGGGGMWGVPPVSSSAVTAGLFPLSYNSRKIDLSWGGAVPSFLFPASQTRSLDPLKSESRLAPLLVASLVSLVILVLGYLCIPSLEFGAGSGGC